MFNIRIGAPLEACLPSDAAWGSTRILDRRTLLSSLGLGMVVAMCMAALWRNCIPASLPLGSPSWTSIFIVVITLVVGHEALHLIGFPKFGLGPETLVGVWPEFGSPYVQHLTPMKRNRFLVSVSLPFLIITLVPLTLSTHFDTYVDHLSWISVLNSIGAGSDMLIFAKLALSAPMKSMVIESGEKIYWSNNISDSTACDIALLEQ